MKSKQERLDAALEKYKAVEKPAWKKYEAVKKPAWKKYAAVKKPALEKYKAVEKPAWKKYQAECARIEKEEKEEADSKAPQVQQKVVAGLRKVISQTNIKQAREVAWDLLKELEAD